MRRALLVATRELQFNARRPLFWIFLLLLGFFEQQMATGNVQIMMSGDNSVGGTKQWLTSEFAVAQVFTALINIMYLLFWSIAAGMCILRDDEYKVGQVLHGTPLTPAEYVWGKFGGLMLSFAAVLVLHVLLMILFGQVLPSSIADDIRGPFDPINYIRPVVVFGVPACLFVAGVAFAVGEFTRKPILVFVLPLGLLLVFGFFLNNWTPGWLDGRINTLLSLVDPFGSRWLLTEWIEVDLGADYYNQNAVGYPASFLLSRAAYVLIGLAAAWMTRVHFARTLRGNRATRRKRSRSESALSAPSPTSQPLAALSMRARPIGLLRGILAVARFELKELRSSPGLYLFIPFILLETIAIALLQTGAFDTPLIQTSGMLAIGSMNTLSLLVCLLLLFYTVESQQRERTTLLAPIYNASTVPTAAVIFGKTVANAAVAAAVMLGAFLGCAIAILVQARTQISLWPFVLVWGVLMIPTFVLWSAFVTLVYGIVRNRYTTYGVALGAIVFTFYKQFTGGMSWIGNWNLWSFAPWSDMSVFELSRPAIVLNRLLVILVAVLFTAMSVRLSARRDWDAARIVHRLRPKALGVSLLRLSPFIVPPVVVAGVLWAMVNAGFQGDPAEDAQKDYWRQNLATWEDAPRPALTNADLKLHLEPATRSLESSGEFTLENPHDEPLARFALTSGLHWEDVEWTLDGEAYEPENRSNLWVIAPAEPIQPGGSVRVGFSFHGQYPKGVTKNGGGNFEFIVPSGVVLNSFSPSFVPAIGFADGVGVDEDNEYESKEYEDDFWERELKSGFGDLSATNVRIEISGPEDFTFNSNGVKLSDEVIDGVRTTVWETDHPVSFFNVIAGRWAVYEGETTEIYYHPDHGFNVEEMSEALDAARKYYSEWFVPYPWQELRISEFPGLAGYAQGFATNIPFSENIGFLTRSTTESDLAFMVVAHEAAHQWWGNILVPGEGPGGNILSEGMAHFSTGLLIEQVQGLEARIEFFKSIEERYGSSRRVDAERPMVKIDGSKQGDTTVQYDKGGWVFWMLLNVMGREAALDGITAFIEEYRGGPDHPVLQDFVHSMRPFAPDAETFDEFVEQWFFEVVVPEYRLSALSVSPDGDGRWVVTGQIENRGTGSPEVQIAATAGERFGDGSEGDYLDSRVTLSVGAGATSEFRIECSFEPTDVVVDPDALVLQLKRAKAAESL